MNHFDMTAEWIKEIPNWEKEYPTMEGVTLSKREKEILDGDEIKSHRFKKIIQNNNIINPNRNQCHNHSIR